MSEGKKDATRRKHLLAGIAAPRVAAAGGLPARTGRPPGRARYLQLASELAPAVREIDLAAADLPGAGDAAALAALFAAWDAGAFVPRLLEWDRKETFTPAPAATSARPACRATAAPACAWRAGPSARPRRRGVRWRGARLVGPAPAAGKGAPAE